MKIYKIFLASLGLVMALCVWPQDTYAQKVTEQFKKPMPEFDLTPMNEFKKKGSLFSKEFQKDEALSYEIYLPENWKESGKGEFVDISVSDRILGELGKFYGPPVFGERSRLVVEAVGLEYHMTAEQWFVQYLLSNGYNLQGLEVHDNRNAEALYVVLEGNISYAVRAVAKLNGKRMLFAQYFVPVERWHDEKIDQALVLKSFNLKNDMDVFVEEMKTYQFLDFAELKYPASWALKSPPIRSVDRMSIELLNVKTIHYDYGKPVKRLDGQIDVQLVSVFVSETLEDEIERFREDLAKKKLNLGEVFEVRDDFLLGDKFNFVDTQVYRATPRTGKLMEHELWLTIMSSGEYYYFVSLFTPSRDYDYFKWAQNTETYKLIVSTIQPKKPEE